MHTEHLEQLVRVVHEHKLDILKAGGVILDGKIDEVFATKDDEGKAHVRVIQTVIPFRPVEHIKIDFVLAGR